MPSYCDSPRKWTKDCERAEVSSPLLHGNTPSQKPKTHFAGATACSFHGRKESPGGFSPFGKFPCCHHGTKDVGRMQDGISEPGPAGRQQVWGLEFQGLDCYFPHILLFCWFNGFFAQTPLSAKPKWNRFAQNYRIDFGHLRVWIPWFLDPDISTQIIGFQEFSPRRGLSHGNRALISNTVAFRLRSFFLHSVN